MRQDDPDLSVAVSPHPDGSQIAVQIQPRASKDELSGIFDGRLKIRITSPPVDGKANKALCRFLSDLLSVPISAITIVRGHTGRRKDLAVRGITAEKMVGLLKRAP